MSKKGKHKYCTIAKNAIILLILTISSTLASIPYSIETDPFGYTGEQQDQESGLIYLRARYYNPTEQHFINADSYTLFNRYSYTRGHVVMKTDRTGHKEKWSGAIKVGAIVGGLLNLHLFKALKEWDDTDNLTRLLDFNTYSSLISNAIGGYITYGLATGHWFSRYASFFTAKSLIDGAFSGIIGSILGMGPQAIGFIKPTLLVISTFSFSATHLISLLVPPKSKEISAMALNSLSILTTSSFNMWQLRPPPIPIIVPAAVELQPFIH